MHLRTVLTLVLSLSTSFLSIQTASADQFVATVQGKEVVVHTNPLPVIFHRLIPPNYGRHITAKEFRESKRFSGNLVKNQK